jgi:hypothetical protein
VKHVSCADHPLLSIGVLETFAASLRSSLAQPDRSVHVGSSQDGM